MSSVLQTPEVSQLLGTAQRASQPSSLRSWSKLPCAVAKPSWRPAALWSPKPASAPAARPKTSSRSRTPAPPTRWTGARSIWPSRRKFSTLSTSACSTTCAAKSCLSRTCICGADPKYRLPIQIINEYAWHNLFVRQLFIRPTAEELQESQARVHHRQRTRLPGRSQTRWYQLRSLHHGELHQEAGTDRRHAIRRRDEEVHLRHHEFPAARAQRLPHALLGQHWSRMA